MTNAFFLLFSSTCNNKGIWALDGAVSALLPVPVRKIKQTERKKVLRGSKILMKLTIYDSSCVNRADGSHMGRAAVGAAAPLPAGAAHANQFAQIRIQSLPSHPTC